MIRFEILAIGAAGAGEGNALRTISMAAVALLALAPSSVRALELNLTCQGTGERTVPKTAFASVTGSNGYGQGTFMTTEQRERAETIGAAISGETGRVQVPRSLLPPIHGGGRDGWWVLNDVSVSDTGVKGHYTLNPFNHPEVQIDRISGSISIDGYGQSFRGTCAAADVAARKF
jgi:hypothetical protein